MSAEQFDAAFWERVRTLFHDAVDRAPGDRALLLDGCDDPALQRASGGAAS
jgi:hypothetical protein